MQIKTTVMTDKKKEISKEIMNMDLYDMLDIPFDATEKMIVQSYRKMALKYHPDKNPGKKSFSNLTIILYHIYEISAV